MTRTNPEGVVKTKQVVGILSTGLIGLIWGTPLDHALADPALVEHGEVADHLYGFTLNGEVVNPRCLDLLQTSPAENTSIIQRSLVLETCQTSELAYTGQDYAIDNNNTIYYYGDPDEGRSYFGYRVLGQTTDGIFVIYHVGTIALYQIETETIDFDFLNSQPEAVQVLTKLSESFVPCFRSATLTPNDMLTLQAERYEANAPRAEQCTGILETTTHVF